MTILESLPVIMDAIERPGRRFTCRRSVFACEPKYRILRAVIKVRRLRAVAHAGLHRLMAAHWQAVRAHSSWSRA